jgi:hypothetical protein
LINSLLLLWRGKLGGNKKEKEQKKSMDFEDTDITYALITAFTDHASGGNPAAVCYLPHEKDDKWLQQIAREFNQPMTAFLVHQHANAESEQYDLRWFTSKAEVLVLNLFLAVIPMCLNVLVPNASPNPPPNAHQNF